MSAGERCEGARPARVRSVLMLCHPFPPTGGAGVQRSTKFAKYLPEHGWRPTVLTVRDGVYAQRDPSLLGDIPAAVRVVRTPTFEPPEAAVSTLRADAAGTTVRARLVRGVYDALIAPDRQVLWLPDAFAAGLRVARVVRPEVVYATGNPYSSFLLARLLGAALGRPYVVDFRDAWTLNWYSWRHRRDRPLTPVLRWRAALERAQERLVLGGAGAAIFVSAQVLADYARAYPDLAGRFHQISNGFDPDDFVGAAGRPADGFTFLYAGKFAEYRRPDGFLRGLALAGARDPAFAAEARAVFVGDWSAEHQAAAEAVGVGDRVVALGYRPHHEAVAYMKGASALALISGGDRTEQPGKVFEYLAADRPILAIIPEDGASGDAIRASVGGGYFADPEDPASIADAMLRLWRARDRGETGDPAARADFDRRVLTGRLAGVLRAVCGEGETRRVGGGAAGERVDADASRRGGQTGE
jgi:glycosyltransferase involved in cell wall biosynthesis